jgi:hypothetical protein
MNLIHKNFEIIGRVNHYISIFAAYILEEKENPNTEWFHYINLLP